MKTKYRTNDLLAVKLPVYPSDFERLKPMIIDFSSRSRIIAEELKTGYSVVSVPCRYIGAGHTVGRSVCARLGKEPLEETQDGLCPSLIVYAEEHNCRWFYPSTEKWNRLAEPLFQPIQDFLNFVEAEPYYRLLFGKVVFEDPDVESPRIVALPYQEALCAYYGIDYEQLQAETLLVSEHNSREEVEAQNIIFFTNPKP